MEERSNYIDWMIELEKTLQKFGIEFSDYDEFFVNDAITETERLIEEQKITDENIFTECMIDEYMLNAIKKEPSKKEYYETVSYYVKRRLLHY